MQEPSTVSAAQQETHWELLPAPPPGSVEAEDLPPAVARILYHRGLVTRQGIETFLRPGPSSLHDPFLLPDMERAVHRLAQAISSKESVAILGDFDVDGVSGTALLATVLKDLGVKVVPYLPHRVEEGHGPNTNALRHLAQQACSLLITVDCGVTSVEELSLAHHLGMDVIITDHHLPLTALPPAVAIINPKLPDSSYPFQELSGAGLAFKLAQGLLQHLGRPWDPDLLCLAAIGTVADVAPLIDENRYLVKEGLRQLSATSHPGFRALYQQASLDPRGMDVEAISYIIAPRINAAGRLEHSIISYKLLTTSSATEATSLAERLEELNAQRRLLSDRALAEAQEEVLARDYLPPLLLVGRDWFQPGIAGLVASKLVEEFNRPAVIMCLGEKLVQASARSIPQFNVARALARCHDLFLRYGGHPQAAGFTMSPQNLPVLQERLDAIAAEALEGQDLRSRLYIDAELPVRQLPGKVWGWCQGLAPFGEGNPPPLFMARNLSLLEASPMGQSGQHLRLKIKEGPAIFDATAFGLSHKWTPGTSALDLVYTPTARPHGGTTVLSLQVVDMRPSSP